MLVVLGYCSLRIWMEISALFLMKLENEFKVVSAALDCIIEDVTTLLNNKNDSLHNELFAKLS